jgi:Protein of unknown function (DUF1360)
MIETLQTEARNGSDPINSDAPSSEVPYGALMTTCAALLLLASRLGREEDARIGLSDVACLGLASHDLARIVARDRIAVFLRAPFASGEAAQLPRGRGMRRAIGELVTCPHCLSIWIATAFTAGFARFPRQSRFVAGVFAGHAVAGISERLFPR